MYADLMGGTSGGSKGFMHRAALAALRGAGAVEPNPLVGSLIVSAGGEVLGIGHHRRFGGPHAEVEALADAARNGRSVRGATVYVTLEPCDHHGKTPPCTDALIAAGVSRVIYARPDPNPVAAGGAERLRAAGIEAVLDESSALARRLTDPFVKRIRTGLPWVIAKWAQTIDGRVATRDGDSKWISGPASRRHVHTLRGRVDAILTGIGTVLADDPLLTARNVPTRRVARRVVIDPALRVPEDGALVRSLDRATLTIVTRVPAGRSADKADRLRSRGVEILEIAGSGLALDLAEPLGHLVRVHDAVNVLVEAGPRLLGALFRARLVDEALVYIAPRLMGDPLALSPAEIGSAPSLGHARQLELLRARTIDGDVVLHYRAGGYAGR